MPKKKNYWQYAFFALVAVIVVSITAVIVLLTSPASVTSNSNVKQEVRQSDVSTTIQLTKAELQAWLDTLLASQNKQDVHISLTEELLVEGQTSVFGLSVPFAIKGDAFPTDDGNIQLKIKNIQAGQLHLPIGIMLQAIQASQALPNWINVDSAKQLLVLNLTQLTFDKGIQVRMTEIDLAKDTIQLKVNLPREEIWQLLAEMK